MITAKSIEDNIRSCLSEKYKNIKIEYEQQHDYLWFYFTIKTNDGTIIVDTGFSDYWINMLQNNPDACQHFVKRLEHVFDTKSSEHFNDEDKYL